MEIKNNIRPLVCTRIEFKVLSAFMDLCITQSISETAIRLGKNKSQISNYIKDIENILELKLVEREHKRVFINEQGLALGKYVYLICSIHEFSKNIHKINYQDVSFFRVNIPLKSFGGEVSEALLLSIDSCRIAFPNIFPLIEFSDSYSDIPIYNSEWLPNWKPLGVVEIGYELSGYIDNEMLTPLCVVSSGGFDLSPFIDVKLMKKMKFIVPRMPWQMLKTVSNFCTLKRLNFKYISEDYTQKLLNGLAKDEYLITPKILLTKVLSRHYSIRDVIYNVGVKINTKIEGKHTVLKFLSNAFINNLIDNQKIKVIWSPSTTWKQWRYFLGIAQFGNLSKASEKLFVSQPALSIQIQKLESNCKVKLFDREMGMRKIKMNNFGNLFQHIAEGLDASMTLFFDSVSKQTLKQKKMILLGVLISVDPKSNIINLIVNQIGSWKKKYPKIEFEILEERHQTLIHQLRSQEIHMAITEVDSPWVTQIPISGPEPLGLIIEKSKGALIKGPLDWKDLESYQLVLPRKTHGLRILMDTHCLQLGLELKPNIESDSLNINKRWVIDGGYSTILPKSVVSSLIAEGIVLFIPLWPNLSRVLKICYLKGRVISPMERNLLGYLLKERS